MPTPPLHFLSDISRESLIDFAYKAMLGAQAKPECAYWWCVMAEYVKSRSRAQVAKMERAKGLR